MSFILNPFIFEQLEDFYERIITQPYTFDFDVSPANNESFFIRQPYNIRTSVYINNETYKIVRQPYTTYFSVTAKNESNFIRQPYTFDSNVEPTSSGLGTLESPYFIYTAYDLDNVRTKDSRSYFRVMNNIDMSGYDFRPLPRFYGDFDGNGKTISNIRITAVSSSVGMFTSYYPLTGRTIRDLTLDSCSIENTSSLFPNLQNYYGILVGFYTGQINTFHITNCHAINSTINVSGSNSNNSFDAGGLIGRIGTAGGLMSCSVQNSYVYVFPTSLLSNAGYAGGLVGQIDSIYQPISCSFVSKTIVYSSRNVDGNTVIGGITGRTNSSLRDCYVFSCSVATTGSNDIDGITGFHTALVNCYSHVNSGSFVIPTASDFYPLSSDLTTTESCYYDYEYGNEIVAGAGVPLSSSQMIFSESFDGFDFVNTWATSSLIQNGYPYLKALENYII